MQETHTHRCKTGHRPGVQRPPQSRGGFSLLVPIGGMDSEGCRTGRKILALEGSSELSFPWRFTPAQEKARNTFNICVSPVKSPIYNHHTEATQSFCLARAEPAKSHPEIRDKTYKNVVKEIFLPAATHQTFDCFDSLHYEKCIKMCLKVAVSHCGLFACMPVCPFDHSKGMSVQELHS